MRLRQKKNKYHGLLPKFSFLGYSDLDVLDFYTGAAERGFGHDVRENWHKCFGKVSFSDFEERLAKEGYFAVLSGELMKFLFGKAGDSITEGLFPPECSDVADEVDATIMWAKDSYFKAIIPI